MGTPRYYSVALLALICSIDVLAALDSAPNVAVLTVGCFLLNQSKGVLLMEWRIAVTALPLSAPCMRFASAYVNNRTGLPLDGGRLDGCFSFAPAYGVLAQFWSITSRLEKSGMSVLMRIVACLNFEKYP